MGGKFLMTCLLLMCSFAARAGDVQVSEAWVRETVAGQNASAAYVTLQAFEGSALVGAASPLAQAVTLHEMVMDGGVMRMRNLDQLALPAGKTVVLRPGSYHIMLTGLRQPLRPGERVPLSLQFRDKAGRGSSLTVTALVRDLTGAGTGKAGTSSTAVPHAHAGHGMH